MGGEKKRDAPSHVASEAQRTESAREICYPRPKRAGLDQRFRGGALVASMTNQKIAPKSIAEIFSASSLQFFTKNDSRQTRGFLSEAKPPFARARFTRLSP
jgi:hypothetical protein